MDEASVEALQEIEEELRALRQERARVRKLAYRDEEGCLIFMTEDESAAHFEGGRRLTNEAFEKHDRGLCPRSTQRRRHSRRR
ncbi:MAG: hypothetical protein ACRED5_03720 [Propylenella sp.]